MTMLKTPYDCIVITGPIHGGKSTLAENIQRMFVQRAYREEAAKVFRYSDVLMDMVQCLIKGHDIPKTPKEIREFKDAKISVNTARNWMILFGDLLRAQEVDMLSGIVSDRIDVWQSYSDPAGRFPIIDGAGLMHELDYIRQRGNPLIIHQDSYQLTHRVQTPAGARYPNDCRYNLRDEALLINPDMREVAVMLGFG